MMTRRQRCLAAIRGDEVDRVPRYLPGIACEVASRLLGRKVNTGTGTLHYSETLALLQGDAAHEEFVERLLEDLAEINRALDIDVYRIPWRQTRKPTLQIDEYTFLFGDPDGDHEIMKYCPESGDFGTVKTVQAHPGHPEEALRSEVETGEKALEEGALDRVALDRDYLRVCEKYGDEFFVVCNGGGISVGMSPDDLMMVALEPGLVRRKVMLQARRALAYGEALAETPWPRVLIAGGDMAGTDGPFYSPQSFREIMLPACKFLMEGLAKVGVHYVFRTDGNMWAVSDMLFGEARCPGYGEVDRSATMTAGALRERYPDLVIWNNLACQDVQSKSAEWVREESLRCIEESGGTAYFHGSSNAIMAGTPVENVEAMFSV